MTNLCKRILIKEINIEAKKPIPNPSMTNASPIRFCVIINVIALIIKIKNPNVSIVIGSVKIIKIGLTIKLRIDKIRLASKAVLKSSI